MYILKQIPEDFIVKEISTVVSTKDTVSTKNTGSVKDIVSAKDTSSFLKNSRTMNKQDQEQKEESEEVRNKKTGHDQKYFYFLLKKKSWNTLDAVKVIAKALNLREKEIGFAGSKDRNAVTEQVISFLNTPKSSEQKISSLNIKDISLTFLGIGNTPLSLGDLQGNKFMIVVRNGDNHLLSFKENELSTKASFFIPNYFDEQRFSENNVRIGKYLLKKEFNLAAQLVDDHHCQEHLKNNPHDYVGALKRIPIRQLRMYINAFQSYVWNETLKTYLEEKVKEEREAEIVEIVKTVNYSLSSFIFINHPELLKEEKIPMVGFNSSSIPEPFQSIITLLMKKENMSYSDFIIKQIPELSLEGEFRKAMIELTDFHSSSIEDDDLNSGKKKVTITFSLPKGSYATIVVKALF